MVESDVEVGAGEFGVGGAETSENGRWGIRGGGRSAVRSRHLELKYLGLLSAQTKFYKASLTYRYH
jgi:hypothetical protein